MNSATSFKHKRPILLFKKFIVPNYCLNFLNDLLQTKRISEYI
jgi:hypothetical protein